MLNIFSWLKGLALGALSSIASYLLGLWHGKEKQKRKQLEEENESLKKQAEISFRPRASVDTLLDRMRGKK